MRTMFELRSLIDGLVANGSLSLTDIPVPIMDALHANLNSDRIDSLMKRIDSVRAMKYVKATGLSRSAGSWKTKRNNLVGSLFEELIKNIFDNPQFFTVTKNPRSNSSELDHYVTVHQTAKNACAVLMSHNSIIIEAKCHFKRPKSELVNEMVGVSNSHGSNFSLIFLFCASGNVPQPFLESVRMNYRGVTSFTVLPLGRSQIQSIIDGRNVLQVLEHQFNLMKGNLALAI